MAIVDLLQLQQHASKYKYKLSLIPTPTVAIAKGILKKAVELDVPIILGIEATCSLDELMPSIELLARRAKIASAIVAKNVRTVDEAVLAVRFGCNGLALKSNLSASLIEEIGKVAESCGIAIIDPDRNPECFVKMDTELDAVTLQAIKQTPSSWQKLDELVKQSTANYIHDLLKSTMAIGQGQAALENCDICRPIEHLIIYNFNADDNKTAELAAKGREVLDKIPGVRQTWSGYSVKKDASYRWCWLFRFANAKVIDSYREHPDHVAYADNHFRPYATDRVSIDYELIGTEEEK